MKKEFNLSEKIVSLEFQDKMFTGFVGIKDVKEFIELVKEVAIKNGMIFPKGCDEIDKLAGDDLK